MCLCDRWYNPHFLDEETEAQKFSQQFIQQKHNLALKLQALCVLTSQLSLLEKLFCYKH